MVIFHEKRCGGRLRNRRDAGSFVRMSPFQKQLQREARWDTKVTIVWLAIFFGCMLVLPRSWFWFYFVPLAAFWYRYIFVRDRRDEALLSADVMADGGGSPAGAYCSEAGICISDGTHQVLIARQKPQPLLQLPHIVRDE